jgi:hypothetical protein
MTRAWPTALAATLALFVGYVASNVFTGAPSQSPIVAGVVPVGEEIRRGHPYFAALETKASAEPAATGLAGVFIEPVLTFKSQSDAYCREFLARRDDRGARAVACREDGVWTVRAAVTALFDPEAPAGYQTASAEDNALIDDYVAGVMTGDALDAGDEEALIANQWRE